MSEPPLPPFLDPDALRDDAAAQQARALPPQAAVAGQIGERVDEATLAAVEQHADLAPEVLARIAAWPLPALLGATLELVNLGEAAAALQQLLRSRVPGIDWQVPDDLGGPLARYLMLHTSLAAPPNEAVPEPMALEVYAACVSVDGVRLDTSEGEAWYRGFLAREARHSLHALGRLRFEVRAATWSNVSYPGVGVPFYL
jgi:hypothetical protein